jgi:hypothetical protein
MDIDLAILLPYMVIGALSGVAYSVWMYFTKTEPGSFEVKRFVASVIFGVGIGAFGGYTVSSMGTTPENIEWWALMATLFLTYQGALQYVNRFVDVLWVYLYGSKLGATAWFADSWTTPSVLQATADELKTVLIGVPYYRRMNEERLHNMVFDQPVNLQQPIRDCVTDAESKTTWRYAIQAGAWEYLIEYGVQTGGKHYWYYKAPKVQWKPISVETLEKIRSTGKWPDYSQLT